MKTETTILRISWSLIFTVFFSLMCLSLSGQTAPRLAKLDWRNLLLQERHAAFESSSQEGEARKAAALAQGLIDEDLSAVPDKSDPQWPRWNLVPDPLIEGLYFSPRYFVSRRLQSGSSGTKDAYQELFGKQATFALRQAESIGSRTALQYVANRFSATQSGADAMAQLALEVLETGDYLAAYRQFMDLLDLHWQAKGKETKKWRTALGLSKSMEQEEGHFALGTGPSGLTQSPPSRVRADLAKGMQLESLWEFQLPTQKRQNRRALVAPIATSRSVIFHRETACTSIDRLSGEENWQVIFDPDSSKGLPFPSSDPLFDDLRGAITERDYLLVTSRVMDKTRQAKRTLWALNQDTGRTSWRLDGSDMGFGIPALLLDGAPLVHQGTVYLTATDKADDVASYVLALQTTDGRIKWVTKIGTGHVIQFHQSNNEVPNPRTWLGSLPLAIVDGFLVCCDNLGHIAAFETDTGRPRFLLTYGRRNLDIAGHLQKRSIARGWEKNPILSQGDRFVVAADDSDALQAFFVRPPGDERRRRANFNFLRSNTLPRHRMQQLLSFDGEGVILAGKAPMVGLSLVRKTPVFSPNDKSDQWTFPLATKILGRGYSGQKHVYVSTHKYVYPLDLHSGRNAGVLVKEESDGSNLLGHVIIDRFGMIVAAKNAIRFFAQKK